MLGQLTAELGELLVAVEAKISEIKNWVEKEVEGDGAPAPAEPAPEAPAPDVASEPSNAKGV